MGTLLTMSKINRRAFLAASAAAVPMLPVITSSAKATVKSNAKGGPIAISSGNGLPAVTKAVELMRAGSQPTEAVVQGVAIVESNPNDMSVGYGGLPNENGIVQLDSSVMDGPTHKAGAVAAIENIMNPAQVALKVLRRTDHVLLVGDGAKQFALAHGFKAEDLLTDKARKAWLKWKENLNPNDDWLDHDQHIEKDPRQARAEQLGIPYHYGTIHCSALDANGDLGACTTTSGLSYKIPGRAGDSPIIGAGMYVQNEVGSAGATGRGESLMQSCGSFQIVQHMANGDDPTQACLKVLKWIADHTKRKVLLNSKGQPNFGATLYALRKDGAYGCASMHGAAGFTVHDGTKARRERSAFLYEK